jgi:putative addiction module component (TIGR02574 family)
MVNLSEILQLSVSERILMMEQVWDSIERDTIEIPSAHRNEIKKRLDRYKAGQTNFFSWEEVKRDLRNALKK